MKLEVINSSALFAGCRGYDYWSQFLPAWKAHAQVPKKQAALFNAEIDARHANRTALQFEVLFPLKPPQGLTALDA